jgi:hypothetical protein
MGSTLLDTCFTSPRELEYGEYLVRVNLLDPDDLIMSMRQICVQVSSSAAAAAAGATETDLGFASSWELDSSSRVRGSLSSRRDEYRPCTLLSSEHLNTDFYIYTIYVQDICIYVYIHIYTIYTNTHIYIHLNTGFYNSHPRHLINTLLWASVGSGCTCTTGPGGVPRLSRFCEV